MYERGVKMVCLAEALPHELFDPGPGRREDMPDEVFAFGRTASRLTEMQGPVYLQRRVCRLRGLSLLGGICVLTSPQFDTGLRRSLGGVKLSIGVCVFERFV